MSINDAFRFLDIQKSTTKDIIDVIKNDELFSSCCNIIEEKNLSGQDILNLNEIQILAWKSPPWLIRNLMSLKSTLSKNIESNKKHNIQTKFAKEKKYLSLDNNHVESEAFYDDDNYLKPSAINPSVKVNKGYGKPLPKLPPSTDSSSTKFRKDRNKSPSAFRNPIPSPREDTEENVYEPAPNSSNISSNNLPMPYSTPTEMEEDNVYETPPILPHRFQQPNTTKFYSNSPLSSNRNEKHFTDTLDRNYTNVEVKRDFPPKLPVRTMSFKKLTVKENRKLINPPYANVVNQLSEENLMRRKPSFHDQEEVIVKNFTHLPPVTHDSNTANQEVSKGDRSGISGRPLPPLPRRNSMNESRTNVNDKNIMQGENMTGEGLKYYSLRKTSYPPDILQKSGNTGENSLLLQSDILQELRTSVISPFKNGSRNNMNTNANVDKYDESPSEQKNHEDMKTRITNSTTENKSSTNFLSEIKKIKLRSTKHSTQKDKTTSDNDDNLTKSSGIGITSKLMGTSLSNETKFRSIKSTVMINKHFVDHSAEEQKAVMENKQQQNGVFNTTKVNLNNAKDPNDDVDQSHYINYDERKKILFSSPRAQMSQKKSQNISEGGEKKSAEFVMDLEDKNKNVELNQQRLKGTNQTTKQSEVDTNGGEFSSDENDENLPEYLNNPVGSSAASEFKTTNESPISKLISELSKKTSQPINYLGSLDDKAAEILKQKLMDRRIVNIDQNETSNYSSKRPVKLAVPPSTLPTTFSADYLQNPTDESQQNSEQEYLDDYDEFDGVFNLNNERYYRHTDRKGAMLLLEGLENGAFVLRPSKEKKFFLSITVKTRNKYYNIGIIQTESKHIFCGKGIMRSPNFPSIKAFLEYFEQFPLMLQGENGVEYVYLRKVLPDDRF